jgi:hypothetical protein
VSTLETSVIAQQTTPSVLLMENVSPMLLLKICAQIYSSVNAQTEHHSNVLMASVEDPVLNAHLFQAAQWVTICALINHVSETVLTPLILPASLKNAKLSKNVMLVCTSVRTKIAYPIHSSAQPESLVTVSTMFFAQIKLVPNPS